MPAFRAELAGGGEVGFRGDGAAAFHAFQFGGEVGGAGFGGAAAQRGVGEAGFELGEAFAEAADGGVEGDREGGHGGRVVLGQAERCEECRDFSGGGGTGLAGLREAGVGVGGFRAGAEGCADH